MSAPQHYARANLLAQDVERELRPELLAAIEHGWPENSETEGPSALARYLERNRPALQAWRVAAQGDGAEYATDELDPLRLRQLQVLRRLALLDARLAQREGRDDDALETLTLMMRFANHYAGGKHGNEVRLLKARMVEHAASELILELILRSACSEDSWRATLDVLEQGARQRTHVDRLVQNGDRFRLEGLRRSLEEDCDWQETLVQQVLPIVSDGLQQLAPARVEAWDTGDTTGLENAIANNAVEVDVRSQLDAGLGEDELMQAQGVVVEVLSLRSEITLLPVTLAGHARMDMLRARIAWHLYESGTGHAPSSLDALVPDLLEAVPRDPFAPDEPLRVAHGPGGWWLYSIGPDRKDQGGEVEWMPFTAERTGDVLLRPSYVLSREP